MKEANSSTRTGRRHEAAALQRYKLLVIDELMQTGVGSERFGHAGSAFGGHEAAAIAKAAGDGFSEEERTAFQQLLEWPGCYAVVLPDRVPYPPPMPEQLYDSLRARCVREPPSRDSDARVVVLYMACRARALLRYRAAKNEA